MVFGHISLIFSNKRTVKCKNTYLNHEHANAVVKFGNNSKLEWSYDTGNVNNKLL